MLKTENYNLNKPEAGDPLRVADFNENADILDVALNSLNTAMGGKAEQSAVTALSQKCDAAYSAGNLPWETGVLDLTGAEEGTLVKTFDTAPTAILITADPYIPALLFHGGTGRVCRQDSSDFYDLKFKDKKLTVTWVNGEPVTELEYLLLK